jgi:hypothetical protein
MTSPNRTIAAIATIRESESWPRTAWTTMITGAISAATAIVRIRQRVSLSPGAAVSDTVVIDGCNAAAPQST